MAVTSWLHDNVVNPFLNGAGNLFGVDNLGSKVSGIADNVISTLDGSREDSSMQRMVSDLQKAGLSKSLASSGSAGGYNSSSSVVGQAGSDFMRGSSALAKKIATNEFWTSLRINNAEARKAEGEADSAEAEGAHAEEKVNAEIASTYANTIYTSLKGDIEKGNLDVAKKRFEEDKRHNKMLENISWSEVENSLKMHKDNLDFNREKLDEEGRRFDLQWSLDLDELEHNKYVDRKKLDEIAERLQMDKTEHMSNEELKSLEIAKLREEVADISKFGVSRSSLGALGVDAMRSLADFGNMLGLGSFKSGVKRLLGVPVFKSAGDDLNYSIYYGNNGSW
ncbi:hypothetical protein [Capybara microvirus Cap1_SP_108]|nr:hypothetical protein [Capybara microvirus Cap1_SP_108]